MALQRRALKYLLARPRLWNLILAPLVLNGLLFVGLLFGGWTFFSGWLEGLLGRGEGLAWYWATLVWLARILFWAIVLVAVYFVFTPVALLIASPFNDLLAERTEREHGFGLPEDGRGLLRTVAEEAAFAVGAEARRLLFFGAVFVGLLALQLLPLLGALLYLAGGFAFSVWAAGYEFISYAADRRHLGLAEKRERLGRDRPLALGFGLATFLLLLVPFLNVLVVPVSAIGGSLLFGMLEARQGGRGS